MVKISGWESKTLGTLINEGKIAQFGKPEEIINAPSCDFVKNFILNQLEIKRKNIISLFSEVS